MMNKKQDPYEVQLADIANEIGGNMAIKYYITKEPSRCYIEGKERPLTLCESAVFLFGMVSRGDS